MTILRDLNKPREIIWVLTRLAQIAFLHDENEQAESYLYDMLVEAHKSGQPRLIAGTNVVVGFFNEQRGNIEQALIHLQEALPVAESQNNPVLLCNVTRALGACYAPIDPDRACTYMRRALTYARKARVLGLEYQVLGNWAFVAAVHWGAYEEALDLLYDALKVEDEGWQPRASLRATFALTYSRLGQMDRAPSYLGAALRLARETKNRHLMGNLMQLVAELRQVAVTRWAQPCI